MTNLADHPRSLAEFRQAFTDATYVDAVFVDLTGNCRGKRIPIDEAQKIWETGVNIPYSIYFLNVQGGCDDPCGMGESDGDPDGVGIAMPDTLRAVPWTSPPGAQVVLRLTEPGGEYAWTDPRTVAENILADVNAMGLRPVVAFELEFYLFDIHPDESGAPQPARFDESGPRESGTNVYDFASLDARSSFFQKVRDACDLQGINASVVTSEFAPGQYEINLRHNDDPVAAAEECVLFRRLVQGVAASCGMRASFMAKPFAEQTGSGMHVHMSMLNESGENVFASKDDEELEPRFRHVIGGLLELLPASMAILAPNVNAWRRFVPGSFVPMNRSWGHNNRTVACRIPASAPDSTRVEHRVAGADANPYLVLAALLAGAVHGLRGEIDPGQPVGDNAAEWADTAMPTGFVDALGKMRDSEPMQTYFEKRYVDLYSQTKLLETEAFHAVMSAKEYEWYL